MRTVSGFDITQAGAPARVGQAMKFGMRISMPG